MHIKNSFSIFGPKIYIRRNQPPFYDKLNLLRPFTSEYRESARKVGKIGAIVKHQSNLGPSLPLYSTGRSKLYRGFSSYLEDVTSHQKQRSATSAHLQSYEELIAALSVLGLQKEEQNAIFMILAAILLLGNVRFTEEPGGNQPFAGETERFVKSAAVSSQKFAGRSVSTENVLHRYEKFDCF